MMRPAILAAALLTLAGCAHRPPVSPSLAPTTLGSSPGETLTTRVSPALTIAGNHRPVFASFGPREFQFSASTGLSVATVNNADGSQTITYTNTSPSSGGTLTATSVSGPGFWYSNASSLETTGVVLGGDVQQGTHSVGFEPLTVQGLKGNVLPTLSTGYLNWNGTAWALSSLPTAVTVSGTSPISVTGARRTPWRSPRR